MKYHKGPLTQEQKDLLFELKIFYTVSFYNVADLRSEGACDTCDYGSERCMSLEATHEVITKFILAKEKEK